MTIINSNSIKIKINKYNNNTTVDSHLLNHKINTEERLPCSTWSRLWLGKSIDFVKIRVESVDVVIGRSRRWLSKPIVSRFRFLRAFSPWPKQSPPHVQNNIYPPPLCLVLFDSPLFLWCIYPACLHLQCDVFPPVLQYVTPSNLPRREWAWERERRRKEYSQMFANHSLSRYQRHWGTKQEPSLQRDLLVWSAIASKVSPHRWSTYSSNHYTRAPPSKGSLAFC